MSEESLPYRKIGQTEMRVTVLSMGGAGIGGMRSTNDDETGVATVVRAVDRGINLLDTSPFYGQSERRIGLALRHLAAQRTRPFLSTKTGHHPARRFDYSGGTTRWSVENSLQTLGVDSADLVFVHDPKSIDPVLVPGAALDTLEQLRAEGKLRWIGISDRGHDILRKAISTGRFDAILTFGDYNLIRQTALPLINEASQVGVGVLVAHVFLAGLLAGPDPAVRVRGRGIPEHLHPDVALARDWWLWARERNVSLRALALQYTMRNPIVSTVVVGADSPDQVDEITSAALEPIPGGIWHEAEKRIAAQAQPDTEKTSRDRPPGG